MEIEKTKYDTRHGGPNDRGGADFYYGRGRNPHYYEGGTYSTPRVDEVKMTSEEVAAYSAGYDAAEEFGDRKDYGFRNDSKGM